MLNQIDLKKFAIIGGVALVALLMMLLFSKLLIYVIICALTGFIVYIRYTLQLPVKIEPYLFFSVIITLGYGIGLTVLFIFISMLIPKLIAGGEVDGSTLVYLVIFLLMNVVALNFRSMGISRVGVLVSIADFIIIIALGAAMKPEKLITGLLVVGINIFLFTRLGEPILTLITGKLI